MPKYMQFRDVFDDLSVMPDEVLESLKMMIKTVADQERKKDKAAV
jgi:hypothetical protein